MAFDFPANPSLGQPYVASGITYIFDGIAWNVSAAPNAAVLTANTRNYLINGDFTISQENGNNIGTTNGYHPADTWQVAINALTVSTARGALAGYPFQISYTVGTKASLAANDYCMFITRLEGVSCHDLLWGGVNAQPAVLRFEANCTMAGTYSVAIQNGDGTRSFLAPITIGANAWTTFVVPIPGDTTGTWALDVVTTGIQIYFSTAIGSTFNGVLGWQGGNKLAVPGMTNGAATGCTFYLRNVGFYKDPLATGKPPPWQPRTYAEEFDLCRRFWQSFSIVVENGTLSQSTTFPTPMRVAPTCSSPGAGFTAALLSTYAAQFYQNTRAYGAVTLTARL
jgi:hypothetical protein